MSDARCGASGPRPHGTQGPAGCCIKLIQPDSPVFAGKGAAAAEELLIAAALQQSIANKSEHWAPVYELGYDGKNAFYVSKLFERSLQRMIDLKVKVSSSDLLTITSAIVEGLVDLETAFDRSHSNLKPANVLIAGKGRIRREDVRLTDPNAGDQERPSITRSPDAKAIGEIIFSLVTWRPHGAARWPVAESVEWDRLGSSGLQWLDLCNDLINTMARQGPMKLGKIQARLNSMRPGRRRIPRIWFATAGVVGLVAGGYIFRDQVLPELNNAKVWATHLAQTTGRSTSPVAPSTSPVLPMPVATNYAPGRTEPRCASQNRSNVDARATGGNCAAAPHNCRAGGSRAGSSSACDTGVCPPGGGPCAGADFSPHAGGDVCSTRDSQACRRG